MVAPITLLCDLSSGIDVPHSVGAGSHAVTAADTPMRVDIDDPIRAFDPGIDRAYSHTDRIFTIVTHDWKRKFSRMRIVTLLDFLYPGAPHTERNVIFTFTDYGACIAANALS